jgi:hypothetical protein
MRKEGDALDTDTLAGMKSHYEWVGDEGSQLAPLFATVPAVDHVELERMLLQSATLDEGGRLSVEPALAESLEAAGQPEEALTEWRNIQTATQGKGHPNHVFTPRVNATIKRLSGPR